MYFVFNEKFCDIFFVIISWVEFCCVFLYVSVKKDLIVSFDGSVNVLKELDGVFVGEIFYGVFELYDVEICSGVYCLYFF